MSVPHGTEQQCPEGKSTLGQKNCYELQDRVVLVFSDAVIGLNYKTGT